MDELVSSCANDIFPGGGWILVVSDSIIRGIDGCHYDRHTDCMVNRLPGAKGAGVAHCPQLDRWLVLGRSQWSWCMFAPATCRKCSHKVLEAKFRLLDRMLKARTFNVAFSKMLQVPHTGPASVVQASNPNVWMRHWLWEEGFGFDKHRGKFCSKPSLYKRYGIHMNQNGSRTLRKDGIATFELITWEVPTGADWNKSVP